MPYSYKESADILNFLNENCSGALRLDALNEDTQPLVLSATLNKMLDMTLSRYSKIDFTDIEKSHGDPVECRFYKNLREAIDFLMDIDETTHKIPTVTVISTALENLIMLKDVFKRAFRTKNTVGMMLYNIIYYTIMEATSYVIAASVDFVRDGDKMVVDAREINGRDVVLITNLERFNKEVPNGNVEKYIRLGDEFQNIDIEDDKPTDGTITESVGDLKSIFDFAKKLKKVASKYNILGKYKKEAVLTAGILGFLYVAINIIPIVRGCAYVIYKFKHRLAESARMQAELLEANIAILKANNADESTIKRQEAAAEKFRKRANAYALEYDKAQNEAKKEDRQDPVDANAVLI